MHERTVVCRHDKDKMLVFCFRGTTKVEMSDIKVELGLGLANTPGFDSHNTGGLDAGIAVNGQTQAASGELPPRIQESIRLLQAVVMQSKYTGYTVHVTGHSLGGMIAMNVAVRCASVVSGGHVFNAGGGGREIARLCGLMGDDFAEKSKSVAHHHIYGDPISMGFSRGMLTVYRPCFRHYRNPHTMRHFLPEENGTE